MGWMTGVSVSVTECAVRNRIRDILFWLSKMRRRESKNAVCSQSLSLPGVLEEPSRLTLSMTDTRTWQDTRSKGTLFFGARPGCPVCRKRVAYREA